MINGIVNQMSSIDDLINQKLKASDLDAVFEKCEFPKISILLQ